MNALSSLSCNLTPTQAHCAMSGYDSLIRTYCNIDCAFENKTVWIQLTSIIIVVLAIFQLIANCFIIRRIEKTRKNRIEEPLFFAEKFTMGVTTTIHTITVLACSALVSLTFFWSNFPESIASSWKDNVNFCVKGD